MSQPLLGDSSPGSQRQEEPWGPPLRAAGGGGATWGVGILEVFPLPARFQQWAQLELESKSVWSRKQNPLPDTSSLCRLTILLVFSPPPPEPPPQPHSPPPTSPPTPPRPAAALIPPSWSAPLSLVLDQTIGQTRHTLIAE